MFLGGDFGGELVSVGAVLVSVAVDLPVIDDCECGCGCDCGHDDDGWGCQLRW